MPSQRTFLGHPPRAEMKLVVNAAKDVKQAHLPDFSPPLFKNKESVMDEKFEMNGQRLKINVQIYSKNQN